MSDLGRCADPNCGYKWDREADPVCPKCGLVYQPPGGEPGDAGNSATLTCACRSEPFGNAGALAINRRYNPEHVQPALGT